MDLIKQFFANSWSSVIYVVLGLGTTAISLFWSKHPVRWLLAVATIALAVFIFFNWTLPSDIDPALPAAFQPPFFKVWVYVLGLVTIFTVTHLVGTFVTSYWGLGAKADAEATFPDVDAAWDEVLIQLSQARIDLALQDLYVLLSPDEETARSVVTAAGMPLFARAPGAEDAPLHAYAAAEGLFLSVSGASALGRQDAEGTDRLTHLCRKVHAANPDRPILRGVVVILPVEWARPGDSLRRVAAIRDDLQTIARTFRLRAPTVTVFAVNDVMPGFLEFASRLPAQERHQRTGFSVPSTLPVTGAVFRRGLTWEAQWLQVSSLRLMAEDVRNVDGNRRLLGTILVMRKARENLASLLEASLILHVQTEPVLYRGCYFVAPGPDLDHAAFAAGLLNGAKGGKVQADKTRTTWSRDSDGLDGVYLKASWALGLLTAAVCLPVWVIGVIERLRPLGPVETAAGVGGLVALGLLWVVTLTVRFFR